MWTVQGALQLTNFQTFSTIFKKKIDHYTNLFGYDYVGKVAEEIKRKSQEISADCIDEKMHTTSSLIDRVFIKQHMQMNSTCLKLQFQGTRATKLFMGWYSISRRSKKPI